MPPTERLAAGRDADLAPWGAVAAALAREHGIADLFLERRVERCWRLRDGAITQVETATLEGAAYRDRDGRLVSSDGLERTGLAALVRVPARWLPPVPLPAAPPAPSWEELAAPADPGLLVARWMWRAGLVVGTAALARVTRPVLLDLGWADGRRTVRPWPLAPGWNLPPPSPLRAGHPPVGAVRALLAPQAAATLLHELVGHPLEGDLLLAGSSPWRGRLGESAMPLRLDVWDDPTRWDLPGAYDADDEGVAAAPRRLLEAGVLAGALADAASRGPLGGTGGNARRATVHAPPRPRISNLVVRASSALAAPPRDEADIEIEAVSSGTLEARSGLVLLQVRAGYALRHGRRTRPLGAFTLAGQIEQVTGGVLCAAGTPEPSAEPGWCGKDGEVVPTGSESPWLLVNGLEAR
ncbi:MAG TPA: metallopeptidase TldD-related protein [Thermoanaerobaculaceae bacterium]|nr:metallopeptidase TldD-related protein [Thermoanaerobaculaceae bacterium]HRS14699.1 metallopeptidase TldD-related protein [Thermoanaerobaculaceae bacterium]